MTINVNSGKPWSPVDLYDLQKKKGLGRGTPHRPSGRVPLSRCVRSARGRLRSSGCSGGAVTAAAGLILCGENTNVRHAYGCPGGKAAPSNRAWKRIKPSGAGPARPNFLGDGRGIEVWGTAGAVTCSPQSCL